MNNVTYKDAGKFIWVNNPCHHTGFESKVCDICGYPDPRKVIAGMKEELKKNINEAVECIHDEEARRIAAEQRIKELEKALISWPGDD